MATIEEMMATKFGRLAPVQPAPPPPEPTSLTEESVHDEDVERPAKPIVPEDEESEEEEKCYRQPLFKRQLIICLIFLSVGLTTLLTVVGLSATWEADAAANQRSI